METPQVQQKKVRGRNRGFTLIETFVAVTILVTAVAGPLTLASRGLTSAMVARDQLTASFLAQEGVEYIRHKRDSSVLAGNGWLDSFSACTPANGCMVDSKNDAITACGTTCDPLRLDELTRFYGYDVTDPETSYVRTVKITQPSAYEAQIAVTVAWRTGVFVRQLTLTEIITDWE